MSKKDHSWEVYQIRVLFIFAFMYLSYVSNMFIQMSGHYIEGIGLGIIVSLIWILFGGLRYE